MHSSTLTATQVPDGPDLPDLPTHLQGLVSSLESYGVPRFATSAARNGAWPLPPDGAMAYTLDDKTLWIVRAGAWEPFLSDVGGTMRNPNTAWGIVAGAKATMIGDPINTDIVNITAQLVDATVTSNGTTSTGMGPVSAPCRAGRQYRIDATVRFDGGAFPSDGTAHIKIVRTAPTTSELILAVVGVPFLSPSGGGASTMYNIIAYDSPGTVTATYALVVAKRIPVDPLLGLRVRAPCGLGVFDVGPVLAAGPFSFQPMDFDDAGPAAPVEEGQ